MVTPQRIFVAGASGVIGRRVVPMLLQAGHDVTAVGRTREKRELLARLGARPSAADLFDPAAVRRAIAGADTIVNLATSVPRSLALLWPRAWRPMDRVRQTVSRNLAAAALADGRVARMIQESFAPLYPDAGSAWVDEATAPCPGAHVRSALDAERHAQRLDEHGRVAVCLRFGFFYGPDDGPTQRLFDSVRRGWFPLFGPPGGYCSWIGHDDAARAVVAALQVPAGTYNIVDDEPLPRRDLAEGLAAALRVRPPRFMPDWAARLSGPVGGTLARSLRICNGRFKARSGWAPRYPDVLRGMTAILDRAAGRWNGSAGPPV